MAMWFCHNMLCLSYNSFYFSASLNQPQQYGDGPKSLPSPLPMPLADDDSLATENEGDEGEDDEEVWSTNCFYIFLLWLLLLYSCSFYFEMSPGFVL